MKKFLMTISKKNIPKIFLLFLAFLIVMLFSSAKTVYAASGSSNLYEHERFNIEDVYSSEGNIFIKVNAKKRINNVYVDHMNFNSVSISDSERSNSSDYSLTLINGNNNGFLYSNLEVYRIDNLISSNISGVYECYIDRISSDNSSFNLSAANIKLSYFPYKTIKWATAYSYIYFTSNAYNISETGNPWGSYNLAKIFFNLNVDGGGSILPSDLKSIRFSFKDNYGDWVYFNAEPDLEDNVEAYYNFFSNEFEWYEGFIGTKHTINNGDASNYYEFEVSSPSNSSALSNKFRAQMFGFNDELESDVLTKARNNNEFSSWGNGYDSFNYVLCLHHCPRLNKGATKSNNNVENFAVLEFSYLSEDGDVNAASLYNSSQTEGNPIVGIYDEISNELIPYTIDPDTGDLVVAEGYYYDDYGNLINPNNQVVGSGDRNYTKSNVPSQSIWDKIKGLFGSFGSTVKTLITVGLFVLGLVLVLKLVRLLGSSKSKGNNVNITVKTGSNKSRRKKK